MPRFFGKKIALIYPKPTQPIANLKIIIVGLTGVVLAVLLFSGAVWAYPPPGTGTQLTEYGDTFEERGWTYNYNNPKLYNQYHDPGSGWVNAIPARNEPLGTSTNGRWLEGTVRGQPDVVERVRTPRRGLHGSRYSMRLRTRNSGTPGLTEGTLQQDDLLNYANRVASANTPLGKGLNIITRIYLPRFSEWENREGYHLGFRVGVSGQRRGNQAALEDYWPGIWIWFNNGGDGKDHFRLVVRANEKGEDVWANEKLYTRVGWWTFGMSFNPDGTISYYASPGVDDLTAEDLLVFDTGSSKIPATFKPYEIEFKDLDYLFFSIACNDGQWSTDFIVDDVLVYASR